MQSLLQVFLRKDEQVGVDLLGVGRGQTMIPALIGLELSMFNQLAHAATGIGNRHDLIIITVNDQYRQP